MNSDHCVGPKKNPKSVRMTSSNPHKNSSFSFPYFLFPLSRFHTYLHHIATYQKFNFALT